jgi:hypothetical protein
MPGRRKTMRISTGRAATLLLANALTSILAGGCQAPGAAALGTAP